MVIAIGRSAGTCQRPDQKEPVVDNVEGFGFVPEVMFPARGRGFLFFFGSIRIGSAGLICAGVKHVRRLRVTPGRETTMLKTGGCVTGATILARQSRRTFALSPRL